MINNIYSLNIEIKNNNNLKLTYSVPLFSIPLRIVQVRISQDLGRISDFWQPHKDTSKIGKNIAKINMI